MRMQRQLELVQDAALRIKFYRIGKYFQLGFKQLVG